MWVEETNGVVVAPDDIMDTGRIGTIRDPVTGIILGRPGTVEEHIEPEKEALAVVTEGVGLTEVVGGACIREWRKNLGKRECSDSGRGEVQAEEQEYLPVSPTVPPSSCQRL